VRFAPFHSRSHEILLGCPGSGKTTLAIRLCARVRALTCFSPTDDYDAEGEHVAASDLLRPGMLARFARYVVKPGLDVAADFRTTVRALRAAKVPTLLLADEVGDYAKQCDADLTRLHRNGHHDGVTSLLVSQCAVDVPLTCRRTATRVISLLQHASRDLDALEAEYGAAFAAQVRSWRPGDPPAVWTLPTLY
jgi:hypothetical protein